MLTGRAAFTGPDLNAILYQVLNVVPPLPSDLNPGLPPGFDRIVARALAKDPDKRYQSAQDMAADLRNYKKLRGLIRKETAEVTTPKVSTSRSKSTAAPATSSPAMPARPLKLGWVFGLAAFLVVLTGRLSATRHRFSGSPATGRS